MENPCAYQIGNVWSEGILIHIEREVTNPEEPDGHWEYEFIVADLESGALGTLVDHELRVFKTDLDAKEFCRTMNS